MTTERRRPKAGPVTTDERPTGDDAARCRTYRRQIDELLRANKAAAKAIDNPSELWEIRRHLRDTHGVAP